MSLNSNKFRVNKPSRPYDKFLSTRALARARKLRLDPGGALHPVPTVRRGMNLIAQYPWSKMELGDFFFAPIGTKSVEAMAIGFYDAATRNDFEISILRVNDLNGVDSLRVTVSAIGVYKARLAAYNAGDLSFPPSRGDKEQRAMKARNRRKPVPKSDKTNDPFWADTQRGAFEEKPTPAPLRYEHGGYDTAGMSREEKIRLALRSNRK